MPKPDKTPAPAAPVSDERPRWKDIVHDGKKAGNKPQEEPKAPDAAPPSPPS